MNVFFFLLHLLLLLLLYPPSSSSFSSRRFMLQLRLLLSTTLLLYILQYSIIYASLVLVQSPYYSPPYTHKHTHTHIGRSPTNDNSLIHPLSISHFYDEPNRIPSHRLSFNVLPFMVIQLILIYISPLTRTPLAPAPSVLYQWCLCTATVDVWFYLDGGVVVNGITSLMAKDKKQ